MAIKIAYDSLANAAREAAYNFESRNLENAILGLFENIARIEEELAAPAVPSQKTGESKRGNQAYTEELLQTQRGMIAKLLISHRNGNKQLQLNVPDAEHPRNNSILEIRYTDSKEKKHRVKFPFHRFIISYSAIPLLIKQITAPGGIVDQGFIRQPQQPITQ